MTSQFPDLNSKQLVKIAENAGFKFIRQTGSSHAIYMREIDKRRTTIPMHGKKSLKRKTICVACKSRLCLSCARKKAFRMVTESEQNYEYFIKA
jgi:predicted RNA binding protein YcfA (HicA-like mRNA interferase family)